MLLNVLYWVLLILWGLGVIIVNTTYQGWHGIVYLNSGLILVLFIIIGLRVFRTPIQ
jgi:hypothetical protein